MRKDEFVMRGQTSSDSGANTEVLNFSGRKPGYAYKMTDFKLYPSTPSGQENIAGSVTAGKTAVDPDNIDFNNEGLIATSFENYNSGASDGLIASTVINDTFLITQNLILMVSSTVSNEPVNWQCKFKPVKMAKAEEAVANYRQFMISDD